MMMMLQKLPTSLMATFKLAVKGIFSMICGYFTPKMTLLRYSFLLGIAFLPHLTTPYIVLNTSNGVDDQLCVDHENEKEHEAISRGLESLPIVSLVPSREPRDFHLYSQ